jgi:hypothetical protein
MSLSSYNQQQLSKSDVLSLLFQLFPWARDLQDLPVREYACAVYHPFPQQHKCESRIHGMTQLRSWIGRAAKRKGFSRSQINAFESEIANFPVIQTGPHLHLLIEPDAFYTHLFSLLGLKARNSRSYLSYACSTVKFVERGRKGPGWLTLGGRAINVFGLSRSGMIPYSILARNGGYEFRLLDADRNRDASSLVAELAEQLPVGAFPSAAEAILEANQGLWHRHFGPSVDFLQLDDEDVADLVVAHLADDKSFLQAWLADDGQLASRIIAEIDLLALTPWSGWLKNSTHFFWGCRGGRIFPLSLNGTTLTSCGKEGFNLPFTAPSLSEALIAGKIIPNLFLVFVVIAMLPGMRVLGGSRHAIYFPLMRYTLCCALAKVGADDALLKNLVADARPGAWGHRVINSPAQPFALLRENRMHGLSGLLETYGSVPLQQSCGGMESFTFDPLWADLGRAVTFGEVSTNTGPWVFS